MVLIIVSKFYKGYLNTEHWKTFRKYALKKHGEICKDCGATDVRFDIHHLTYENLWEEQLEDVVVLCHPCHIVRHPDKFTNICKHVNLDKATGYGSSCLSFYWHCLDCKSLVSKREPDEKEQKESKKYIEKQSKWHEREAIKQTEKEIKKKEREILKKEKEKLDPKKPKKRKKSKPYKKRVVKVAILKLFLEVKK